MTTTKATTHSQHNNQLKAVVATATATIGNNGDGDGDGGDEDVGNGGGSGNTPTAATMMVKAAMMTTAAAAAAVAAAEAEAATALVAAAAAAAATVANHPTARRKEEVRGGEFFIPTLTWYITRVFFYLTQKNNLKRFRLSHPGTLVVSYPPVSTIVLLREDSRNSVDFHAQRNATDTRQRT